MKALLVSLLTFPLISMAAEMNDGQIKTTAPAPSSSELDASNLTEVGLNFSSINDGSIYASVAYLREYNSGFALGFRGELPMSYSNQAQGYIGQAVGRLLLVNDTNQVFIEGTGGLGAFNQSFGPMLPFWIFGSNFGYTRRITNNISVGGLFGFEYSPDRITQNTIFSTNTIYNRFSLNASYYF